MSLKVLQNQHGSAFPFFSFWEEEETEKDRLATEGYLCACCASDSKAESIQIHFAQALLSGQKKPLLVVKNAKDVDCNGLTISQRYD